MEVSTGPLREQLVILLLDGSGSMSLPDQASPGKSKGEAVGEAVKEFLAELRTSLVAEETQVGVIVFDSKDPQERRPPKPLPATADELQKDAAFWNPLNPPDKHGADTPVGMALEAAESVAKEFFDQPGQVKRFATIVLMSDGMHNFPHTQSPDEVKTIAERIKNAPNEIRVATVAYYQTPTNEDEKKQQEQGRDLLSSLAGGRKDLNYPKERFFKEVRDAKTLVRTLKGYTELPPQG